MLSHKLGVQDLLSARHSRAKHGNPAFLNSPKISNKLDPQTTSEDDARWMCLMFTDKLNVGLVNPTYKKKPPLSEGEGCFQCEDLSIRKQGEGLSRRVCHTMLDITSINANKTDSFRIKFRIISRNNFPLSIFNFPFIQKENRRVRFNSPQPPTKEVLC